jgi:hypothetical protein
MKFRRFGAKRMRALELLKQLLVTFSTQLLTPKQPVSPLRLTPILRK